jgi:two-component system sporulation sensor kinase A
MAMLKHLETHTIFYHFFQNAPTGMALVSEAGRWLTVNPALQQLLGFSDVDLQSHTIFDYSHPDDADKLYELLLQLRLGRGPGSFAGPVSTNHRYFHKNGHVVHIQVSASKAELTPDRTVSSSYMFYFLEQHPPGNNPVREQRYKTLFEYHTDPIFTLDLSGKYTLVNPAFEKLSGYSEQDIKQKGLHYRQLITPQDREKADRYFESAAHGVPQTYEITCIDKKGSPFHLEITNIPMVLCGEIAGVYGIGKDITLQKRLWKNLCDTELLYEMLSANSLDIISYLDPKGMVQYISPAVFNVLGYRPEALVGRAFVERIHPEDLEAIWNAYEEGETNDAIHVYRVAHEAGHYIWLESSVKLIRGEEGNVVNILSVGRDISERKRAEEALMKSEEKYRKLIEELPEAFLIMQQHRWVYVNETAARLLGAVNKNEIIGRNLYDMIHPDFHRLVEERLEQVRSGKPAPFIKEKYLSVKGQPIDVEVSSCPFQYEGEPAVLVILRDISESEKAQELLQNSEKLSLVGQLAAGIAHEIRNPLTAVKGFISLLKSEGRSKPLYYDVITSEMNRIEEILNEMLVLAKPQSVRFVPRDIRVLLAHVTTLIETQAIMNSIEIVTEYECGIPYIDCDENQLKQVFINFLKNALEAMPYEGQIRIQAGKKGPEHVVVRVIDQGCGIPKEKLARIGQPFFTTKEKGTGLGMMVSYKIIENHGGTVEISSIEGTGTTIEITLPVSARKD